MIALGLRLAVARRGGRSQVPRIGDPGHAPGHEVLVPNDGGPAA